MSVKKRTAASAFAWAAPRRTPAQPSAGIRYVCVYGDNSATVDGFGKPPLCPVHLIPMQPE